MAIPYIEVEGTNYEIGFGIGSQLKQIIKKFFEKKRMFSIGKFRDDEIEMHYSYFKKTFPKYFEEIKGIADGSGTDFHKLLYYNYSLDYGFKNHQLFDGGCTTIAGVNKNGTFYLSHNEDGDKKMLDYLYLAKIKQGKDSSLSLSYIPELPGLIWGMNSNKIGYTYNWLHLKHFYPCSIFSVPASFIVRFLLDSTKFNNIEKRITQFKRTGCFNYSIIHGTKGIIGIETTPDTFYIKRVKSIFYHTNHFLSRKCGDNVYYFRESVKKYKRIKELVGKRKTVGMPFLKKILVDHKNKPASICNHGTRGYGNPRGIATLAGVIMDPSNKTMYVAHGNPCKSHFMKYEL